MRLLISVLCVLVAFSAPAAAQMSITTIGATDAHSCYKNAADDFARDVRPCDKALADRSLSGSDRKKTYVNRGIIFNRAGRLSEAVDDFNAALDIDSALGEAYLNRGNSYFLGKQYDAALSDYEEALAFDISKPWAAWYNIGLVHQARQDKEAARAAYERALESNPDFYSAKRKLAELDAG